MSLQSELTRLQANVTSISSSKDDIMTALASKGVTVPPGATLHDVPGLIGEIAGMGPGRSTVTIGGREYPTVKIGSQWWMAENLDYKWDGLNNTFRYDIPSAVYYDNDETTYGINGYRCGLLYNSHAMDYLETNKSTMLPSGWRVPALSDITILKNYINDSSNDGYKLSRGGLGWAPSWDGSDEYGLGLIPSGQTAWDTATSGWKFNSINVQAAFHVIEHNYVINRYNGDGVNNQLRASTISIEQNYQAGYSLRLVKNA